MKIIYKFLVITTLFGSKLNGQKINEFIIGSWYDPRLTFTNRERDKATLDSMEKAYFNLLSGYNLTYKKTANEYKYVLGLLEELNAMQLLVMDEKINYKIYNNKTQNELIKNYNKLKFTQQKRHLGYHLGDEPPIEHIENVNKWINGIKKSQKGKVAYIGLFPVYVGYDTSKYRKYLNEFSKNNSNVVGVDYYPFINGGMRGDYYWNMWVLSDVLKKYPEKSIWHTVYAVEHYFYNGPKEPITVRYAHVTQAILKCVVHTPLLYGAKGILYFTYESPGKDNWNDEYEPAARENPFIYNSIKSINEKLKNIGPQLISLKWIETVHGTTKNNYSNEMVPIVGKNTHAISELMEDDAAAGIFIDAKMQTHLLLMNKDTLDTKYVKVKLKNGGNVEFFNAKSTKWEPSNNDNYNELTKIITVPLGPVEIQLVRIHP